jgi:hypothetical protein
VGVCVFLLCESGQRTVSCLYADGWPNPLWLPRVGRNARDMWVKLDDESDRLSYAHLGVIADLVCVAILQYL